MNLTSKTPGQRLASHTNTRRLTNKADNSREEASTDSLGRNGMLSVDRGRYARICVEVDLSRKLRSRVVLRRRAFRVEYEGLGLICFKCGRYGHKTDVCPVNVTQTANPAPPPQDKPP